MADVGTNAHEIVGEQFLKDLGFPEGVTSFVRGHVDAKRYLVFKYPDYITPRYIFLAQKSRDQEVEFSPFYAPLVLPSRFMSVKYSVK